MDKPCQQNNIPTLDNSERDCNYNTTNCIIHQKALTYLELSENSNLTEIIENLLLSLQNARQRIATLETKVNIINPNI